ncbi:MAG: DNA adenine methylase [Myxococcota bacterium]
MPRAARITAATPTSVRAPTVVHPHLDEHVQPIVKWAGGKTRLLPELVSRMPSKREWTGRYFEPFMGGAALFMHLLPRNAQLTDMNAELVNLYEVVRDDVESLVDDLRHHAHEREYYYAVRALDAARLGRIERASRFIFLNRTCFNGLYRVNRRGQFNVPFGRYDNPNLCPEDRLRAVSRALADTAIAVADFEDAVADAKRGDFVYFDPPYVPLTRTANFTSYTAGDFGEGDQRRLADVVRRLGKRGVRCMLSNSDTPFTRELYAGLRIEAVMAPRAISRAAETRRPVSELLVRTY